MTVHVCLACTLSLSSLSFSHSLISLFLLTNPTSPRPPPPAERDPTPLATMRRFLEADGEAGVQHLVEDLVDEVDWDDYSPPLFREEYGRIIRSPLKKKGHVILDTCQADGHLTRSVLSKSEVWQVPTLYSALRKLRWGGIVPVLPLQPQQQRGPLAAAHQHILSEELLPSEEQDPEQVTGFMPSSFVGRSPMSKKSAATDLPVKRVVPPPVTVGQRSPIWKEGEGLKKHDRNRYYQGQGGLVLDEDRGEDEDEDGSGGLAQLHDPEKESREVRHARSGVVLGDRKEDYEDDEEMSGWDEDDDDDGEEEDEEEEEDAGFADEEEGDLSRAKLDSMSKELNSALGRLRQGDLPMPEDVGKERFFPDDVHSEEDDDNDDDDQFGEVSGEGHAGDSELSASELADMDILKQLRQHHSLDSLSEGEGGDMKNIEWEKVFADLQKDGAFDDIDMSALQELESQMQGSNWNDFQGDGDGDEDLQGLLEGGNGLDMDAFAKMLQPDELRVDAASATSSAAGKEKRQTAVSRRQKRADMEAALEDDDEEPWQRGVAGEAVLCCAVL